MLNNKGAFSIIAALLVAIVLVGSAIATFSAIRYNPIEQQPQILSAVDETNLGLKEILGFTVGYYGSILKVTGNQPYANELARNYLQSGLDQACDIRPEWGVDINLTSLDLNNQWFSNKSYSQGNMTVTYNLEGLGISGASYSTSTRLDVEISKANQTSQAQLKILMDNDQPLINLGKNNLKLYRYVYNYSDWELVEPDNIASYADGTYLLDLPQGVNSSSYVIQVEDTRGLMVIASSYSQFNAKLTWNSSSFQTGFYYVDNNLDEVGTHSNFTAQQYGPDGVYDTLTETASGTTFVPSYPTNHKTYNSTTLASGSTNSLQANDGSYMSFRSYGSSFSGSANFGYTTKGGATTSLSSIRGSRFTLSQSGLATNISAYLRFTSATNTLGNTNTGNNGDSIIDSIRGQQITTPNYPVSVQSIAAYIACTTSAKNMKAAIYDNNGNLLASSNEQTVPASSNPAWRTFIFSSAPVLTESTNYILVVWSQTGSGTSILRYSSSSGGNGRYVTSQIYGVWPSSLTPQTNTNQYSIYCNYNSLFKAKAAVYSSTGSSLIGTTEEKTLGTMDNWVTFNFISQPVLAAATDYVLMVWSSDTNANIYRDTGSAQRFEGSGTYPNWPTTVSDQGSQRTYSIYCTYSPANQYNAQVEFTGNSNIPFPWNELAWTTDSSASTSGVSATFQLFNSATSQYPTSGDGYMTTTLGTSDTTNPQIILTSPTSYLNSSGYWKVMVTAVKSTTSPFDLHLDLIQYSPNVTNYALNLQEQWSNVNVTNIRQDLCIKTGIMGTEPLLAQVWHNGVWQNLTLLAPNCFNNVSVAQYIDSTNLTIRFKGSSDETDPTPDSWDIDAVYLKDEPDINFLVKQQQSTFTIEVLQNGTMRWLGQNMQLTTQNLPIPPVPVKAIHINQTINGLNQEVPFQIEDWVSNYQIPLGLTSNASLFSNQQMIVFQLNSQVTDFTIWWNGSVSASQTPLAYTNSYFTDDIGSRTLDNGKLRLQFAASGFVLTSTVGSVISTSNLMRINNTQDNTNPELSYVITNGVVRDIVVGEAEFSGGIPSCPNTYTNIVISLPANVPYYTYSLRIMFIDSQPRTRAFSDLCPVRISTNASPTQMQTENGTLGGFPIVQNGTGTFSNYAPGSWTAHHFSQLISDTGKGVGILFTDINNQKLYTFDSFASSTSKGALKVSSGLIELLPVSSPQVQFTYAYDITWQGAIVTFDGTTPVCNFYDSTTPMGLWILAEYPPTITVTQ